MRSEQLTLMGTTDDLGDGNVFKFRADAVHGTVSEIRIPKGLSLKIWSKHINGANFILETQFTTDITAGSVEWVKFGVDVFNSDVEGDRNIEKRRPLLFRGFTGNEAVRFVYGGEDGSGEESPSGVEINVELCEIQ